MRAQRLQLPTDKLRLMSETNVEAIVGAAQEMKPKVLVVDSIQVVHTDEITSAPGSVSQVRECGRLSDPLCEADRHGVAVSGACDQGRLARGSQGAGAYDRLFHSSWTAVMMPVFARCAGKKIALAQSTNWASLR